MVESEKYSLSLGIFAPCADRFVTGGYHEELTLEKMIQKAASVEGASGLELDYPFMRPAADNPAILEKLLKDNGLQLCTIEIDHYSGNKWKYGALTSEDKSIRKEAVALAKRGMDLAVELKANQINIWLGHDGYDYPMEVDYSAYWNRTIDGIREIAEHRDDCRVCLEYKLKEPRVHSLMGTVGDTLVIANTIGLKNVGVNIDTGHAFIAFENLGNSMALCHHFDKLFYLHWNDNCRDWDHDMIVGSIHLWETLEALYWLNRLGYKGWHSLDIYPYRQNAVEAAAESIRSLKKLMAIAKSLDEKKLNSLRQSNDVTGILRYMREMTIK
jgi:L-rhamnose isomerase